MSNIGQCPKCGETKEIACYRCGLYQDKCECGSAERFCYPCQDDFMMQLPGIDWEETQLMCKCATPAQYYCKTCGVVRGAKDQPWAKLKSSNSTSQNTLGGNSDKGVVSKTSTKKCERHWHQPIDLGNGVIIHCSTLNNERTGGGVESPIPDYGLYADYQWKPTWQSMIIDWPDFKIPKHFGTGAEMIAQAYNFAVAGSDVEIGCIGGHGRTGTILGCMKMLAEEGKMDYKDVVQWVKENYCSHAIETADQEWYISFFSNYWYETPLAERSEKKPKSTSSSSSSSSSGSSSSVIKGYEAGKNCTVPQHYAMLIRGHTVCYADPGCRWWPVDQKEFADIDKDSHSYKSAMKIISKYPLRYGGIRLEEDSQDTHLSEMHAVMFEKGYTECAVLGEDCKYWAEDFEKFSAGDFSSVDKEDALKWFKSLENLPKVNKENGED